MRVFGFIMAILMMAFSNCKKETGNVIVEGRVINVGTQQPIEGVTVVMENEVSFNPSHLDSTMTDEKGYFYIELVNEEEAWIYLKKEGWTFHSSSLNNVTGYLTNYSVGTTTNVKLEMYPDARFGGGFQNNDPTPSDSFCFKGLPYMTSITYGGGGNCYSRIGPYDVYDVQDGREGMLIRGDMFFRYGINYTKNGEWFVKVDSVYVGAFETFTDTIYY